MPSGGPRYSAGVALLAIAYFLAAELGLRMAVVNVSTSPVWPPTGLAIGVLFMMGRRYWPGVALGALWANVATTGDVPSSILIAGGNTVEAVFGAWAILALCGGRNAFDRPVTATRFVFWTGVIAPLVSSLVGATSLGLFGLAPWSDWSVVWSTWYVGDAMGALIVAPAIILAPRLLRPAQSPRWERVAFPTILALVAVIAFGPLRPESLAEVRVGAIALPVIAWAATRMGSHVASVSTLFLAGAAHAGMLRGTIFLTSANPNIALLEFQALLAILSLTGVYIGAIVQERHDAYTALAAARDHLEVLVEERTSRLRTAMGQLHEAQELAGLGRWQYNDRSGLLSGSPWLHRRFDVATAAPPEAWTHAMDPEEGHDWVRRFRQAMRDGAPFQLTFPVHMNGRRQHLQFTGTPLPDGGWHGTCQDVTHAREAAAASHRLAILVEASPYPIIAADAEGTIDTWNRAAEDLLGYDHDEAIGMNLDSIVPDEERTSLQRFRRRVLERREVVELDCERIHKKGHRIPIHLTLAPVEDVERTTPRITAIMRDRRPELEAQRTHAHLGAVVEHAPIAIITLDADGRVLTWNRAAKQLFGHPAREIVGQTLHSILPEAADPLLKTYRKALESGQVIAERHVERVHRDGTVLPVGLTLAPIRDDDGTLRLVTVLARDLRPEMQAKKMTDEASRIEAELRMADQVARLKNEFINMASHELRTPLTPIRVQLHILKTMDLDREGQRRALGVIERNMVRLSELVEDVFAAARLQGGGFALKASDADLEALAHDALLAFEAQAHQNDVSFEVDVRGDLHLRADADRLTQVMFNLVGNALKYTPKGSTIHVELLGGMEHVRLAVEDEGQGIPEELRDRLFQPFSRLDDDTRPGTGLGLYISKGISELHGGRMRLAPSRHKKGARFEVVLPREPVAPGDGEEDVVDGTGAAEAKVAGASG